VSTTSTGSSSPPEPTVPRAPHRPAEIDAALRAVGVVPSKRLGQSFLVNPFVADAEAALVGAAPGEPVLELGGGLGILTEALLRRRFGPVLVVERDRRLATHLRNSFGPRIRVLEGDALAMDLPATRVVVGNLPFSVATPILERLWSRRTPRIVALLQREVAERLAAGPGSKVYGRLSIVAALYGTVELFQPVPAREFHPTPEVEGRMVVLEARPGPLPVPSLTAFEAVLHGLFSARRKQLGNLLPRVAPTGADLDALALRAEWPDGWRRLRPEDLPPEAFFRLSAAIGPGRARARSSP